MADFSLVHKLLWDLKSRLSATNVVTRLSDLLSLLPSLSLSLPPSLLPSLPPSLLPSLPPSLSPLPPLYSNPHLVEESIEHARTERFSSCELRDKEVGQVVSSPSL